MDLPYFNIYFILFFFKKRLFLRLGCFKASNKTLFLKKNGYVLE